MSPTFMFIAATLIFASTSNESHARAPIGKSALESIASMGGSLEQAKRGMAGAPYEIFGNGDNVGTVIIGDGISIVLCGRVYGVTRVLGNDSVEGIDAVMSITSIAGDPVVKKMKIQSVAGGAQGLEFSWPSISEYIITIIKADEVWNVSEGTVRLGLCN